MDDDGSERRYNNDAPTLVDGESLVKYLKKYWAADVKEIVNIGCDAIFEVKLDRFEFELRHHSSLGNYFSSPSGAVQENLKEIMKT